MTLNALAASLIGNWTIFFELCIETESRPDLPAKVKGYVKNRIKGKKCFHSKRSHSYIYTNAYIRHDRISTTNAETNLSNFASSPIPNPPATREVKKVGNHLEEKLSKKEAITLVHCMPRTSILPTCHTTNNSIGIPHHTHGPWEFTSPYISTSKPYRQKLHLIPHTKTCRIESCNQFRPHSALTTPAHFKVKPYLIESQIDFVDQTWQPLEIWWHLPTFHCQSFPRHAFCTIC